LGNLAYFQGDPVSARALLEESLTIYREVGHPWGIVTTLVHLGSIDKDQGDYATARLRYTESLRLSHEIGSKSQIVLTVEALASLAAEQEREENTARLWGAASALRETLGSPLPPKERAAWERAVATVRKAMGEEAFTAAWEEGQAMTLEQVFAYALRDTGE
jgi:hypothetical protein